MTDDALADAVSAAETKLWPALAELAHGRKVLITGFSQSWQTGDACSIRGLAARYFDVACRRAVVWAF